MQTHALLFVRLFNDTAGLQGGAQRFNWNHALRSVAWYFLKLFEIDHAQVFKGACYHLNGSLSSVTGLQGGQYHPRSLLSCVLRATTVITLLNKSLAAAGHLRLEDESLFMQQHRESHDKWCTEGNPYPHPSPAMQLHLEQRVIRDKQWETARDRQQEQAKHSRYDHTKDEYDTFVNGLKKLGGH